MSLNFYAFLMSPVWGLRSKLNLRKKVRVKKSDEIISKIEEFRNVMLSYEKIEKKEEAASYRHYIDALTWVVSDDTKN